MKNLIKTGKRPLPMGATKPDGSKQTYADSARDQIRVADAKAKRAKRGIR